MLSSFFIHLNLFDVCKCAFELVISSQFPLKSENKDKGSHQHINANCKHDEENENVSDSLLGPVTINEA